MAEIGRPTVMTPKTISRLEEAFLNGATDKEAVFLAGISMSTLYAYCQEHPEFSDRKEALKDMPKYTARINVIKAIDAGDKALSQWYLERKAKSEFASRTEHTGEEGKAIAHAITGMRIAQDGDTISKQEPEAD